MARFGGVRLAWVRSGMARVYFQFHFKEILKHDYSDRHEED